MNYSFAGVKYMKEDIALLGRVCTGDASLNTEKYISDHCITFPSYGTSKPDFSHISPFSSLCFKATFLQLSLKLECCKNFFVPTKIPAYDYLEHTCCARLKTHGKIPRKLAKASGAEYLAHENMWENL